MGSEKPAVRSLERLIEGNGRFIAEVDNAVGSVRRKSTLSTQQPFAVVLACSDARVVPELVFDQTIGRLFVIRVAGNVAGSDELASIEYAVARFGCRLVVVLGHTKCGAVGLALDPPADDWEPPALVAGSVQVNGLLDAVRGSFDPIGVVEPVPVDEAWRRAVEQNVRAAVARVRGGTLSLVEAVRESGLAVVGAIYDVETGEVEFLAED